MATKTARMFDTRNDLDPASREKLVELLNARLADTSDLYSQLKQAHWNVKGSDFIQLHELYDTIACVDTVQVVADRLAAYGAAVREAIEVTDSELGDMETSDLFIEISRVIDKHLWFVEAHLQA